MQCVLIPPKDPTLVTEVIGRRVWSFVTDPKCLKLEEKLWQPLKKVQTWVPPHTCR